MGGTWEAKIYLNGKKTTTRLVKNGTSLGEIRNSLRVSDNYHFISRNNGFIDLEDNFTAKNVWKNDIEGGGGYKIDLMTREYFDSNQSEVVNLYFNMMRSKAIKYDPYMTLEEVMILGDYKRKYSDFIIQPIILESQDNLCNKEPKEYYLLSRANIKIENYEGLKAKDIVKNEINGKRIDIVDSEYYKKFQVIEHLRELESNLNFDWLEQTEFFLKVKILCGEEATTAVINELYNDRRNGNGKGNKEFIQRFLNLLIEDNKSKENNNISTENISSKGF